MLGKEKKEGKEFLLSAHLLPAMPRNCEGL